MKFEDPWSFLSESVVHFFSPFYLVITKIIITKSRERLKRLHLSSHVIMTSLAHVSDCSMNSSEGGLPAEQI